MIKIIQVTVSVDIKIYRHCIAVLDCVDYVLKVIASQNQIVQSFVALCSLSAIVCWALLSLYNRLLSFTVSLQSFVELYCLSTIVCWALLSLCNRLLSSTRDTCTKQWFFGESKSNYVFIRTRWIRKLAIIYEKLQRRHRKKHGPL